MGKSFNEAPAILPGKGASAGVVYPPESTASMRPRRFCRGKRMAGMRPGNARGGFNEAPAILPGKAK